jgi:hypothetical protein
VRLVTEFGPPPSWGCSSTTTAVHAPVLTAHGNLSRWILRERGARHHIVASAGECHRLYRNERIRLTERYAWIDTLFSLPEAWLYAAIIDLLERQGRRVEYGRLYDDVREAIDAVHRDNSLKREVRKDIGQYIFRDPELGAALHKLRSGGKKPSSSPTPSGTIPMR